MFLTSFSTSVFTECLAGAENLDTTLFSLLIAVITVFRYVRKAAAKRWPTMPSFTASKETSSHLFLRNIPVQTSVKSEHQISDICLICPSAGPYVMLILADTKKAGIHIYITA